MSNRRRNDQPAQILRGVSERLTARVADRLRIALATDLFTAGQQRGEVISDDPTRIGLVAYAAVQGLVAVSTNGEFKQVPVDTLVGEVIERLVPGLRRR